MALRPSFSISSLALRWRGLVLNTSVKVMFSSLFDSTIAFVEEYPYIIQSLVNSKKSQLLFDILSNEIENDILYHINQDPAKSHSDYPDLFASMIAGAIVNAIRWWI